jgi:hypothetical protein
VIGIAEKKTREEQGSDPSREASRKVEIIHSNRNANHDNIDNQSNAE